MALPTIPTSFVPHPALSDRGGHLDIGDVFGFFAYILLGIAFVLALGVFFYGRVLSASLASKNLSLVKSEASIDTATVQGFIRLRDRLNSSQILLDNHIALSHFFSALESLLPSTVRFTTLHLALDVSGSVKVEGTGIAKSFNALSAASSAFSADGRIKEVIFSKMNVNKDNSVSFGFSGSLDPKLVAFVPVEAVGPSAPTAATTTTP